MGFENFPYTNFHELNLDWIVKRILELTTRMDEFELTNQIHYEGLWDEHIPYTKYAVVSDGTFFYMALQDVLPGILLTNEDYWLKVIDTPVIHADGNWNANRTYTPLAVVTAGNTGYISKQNVPSGTLLSNTSYWQKLYDLTYPEGQKYIFIGDSYGAQTESWIDIVINRLELIEGVTAFRKARPSYGFVGDVAHVTNPTFISLLEEVYTEIDAPETITNIVICGGHNDAYSDDIQTLNLAIKAFVNRAYTLFPNAIIQIGFIAYTGTSAYANYPGTINQYQYASTYKRAQYLTETENAIHSMYYLKSDLTHPNQSGAFEIANAILRCISTGNATNRVFLPFTTAFTPSGLSAGATLSNNSLYTQVASSVAGSLQIVGDFPAGSRPTWTCLDTWQEIASFNPSASWIYGNNRKLTFAGTIHIYNGTNYYRIPATFNFYQGKLYAAFPAKQENSTSNMQLEVVQFKINNEGFNLPFLGT